MAANPYQKYQQQSIATMTQEDLLNLLFETCVKRLNAGLYYIKENDRVLADTNLQKARNIIQHLSLTLNRSYEISGNLAALYDFFISKIIKADVSMKPEPVEEIIPMITDLGNTFKEAGKIVRIKRA